jgi:AcrR family transcriptional regulator
MVTREQRTRAKQAQILAAAGTLFQEQGFDGASTDAIAARAGVSKETLYRHYPSKDRLLVAVMRDIAVEGLFTGPPPRLADGADRGVLERTLVSIATAVLDRILTRRYLALARLLLAESGRRPELTETFRRLVPEAGGAAIMGIFVEAQRQGLLRAGIDLVAVRQLFVGPLLTWVLLGALAPTADDPPRPTRRQVRATVRLLLEGVGTPP